MYYTGLISAIPVILNALALVADGAPAIVAATVRAADMDRGEHINLFLAPNGHLISNSPLGQAVEPIEMPALIDFRSIVAAFSKPIPGMKFAAESGPRPTARIEDLDNTAIDRSHPLPQALPHAQPQALPHVQPQALPHVQPQALPHVQSQQQIQLPVNIQPTIPQVQQRGGTQSASVVHPNGNMAVQQIKNKPVAQVQDIDGEIKPVAHSQSSGKRVASRTMTHVVVQSKDKTAFVIDEDDNNDDAKSSKSDATERAEKADRDEKVDKSSSGPQLDRLGANDSGASSLLTGHGWKLATALLLAASYTGL